MINKKITLEEYVRKNRSDVLEEYNKFSDSEEIFTQKAIDFFESLIGKCVRLGVIGDYAWYVFRITENLTKQAKCLYPDDPNNHYYVSLSHILLLDEIDGVYSIMKVSEQVIDLRDFSDSDLEIITESDYAKLYSIADQMDNDLNNVINSWKPEKL